jgi:hypothetical protein
MGRVWKNVGFFWGIRVAMGQLLPLTTTYSPVTIKLHQLIKGREGDPAGFNILRQLIRLQVRELRPRDARFSSVLA